MIRKYLHHLFFAPVGDGGDLGGGGATLDRGDNFPGDGDGDDIDPDNPDGKLDNPFDDKKDDDKKGEADPEEDPEDEKKAAGKKDTRIPLSRHKEILAKERAQREALEQKLSQFEKGQQVAQTNEEITKLEDGILAMEKQYNKLLADGEIDKASELMSKIRRTERGIVEAKSEMRAQAAEIRARENARYDIALERIEEAYPKLNPDHDDYDKEALADVADLKAVYERRGMTPTKALQAAVTKLLGSEGRDQKQATEVAPRVTEKDVAAERKKEAVKKATDAAKRTPPSTRDVGMDSDKAGGGLTPKDVMAMSQDDFAKLSEEQLSKLRGDIA